MEVPTAWVQQCGQTTNPITAFTICLQLNFSKRLDKQVILWYNMYVRKRKGGTNQ